MFGVLIKRVKLIREISEIFCKLRRADIEEPLPMAVENMTAAKKPPNGHTRCNTGFDPVFTIFKNQAPCGIDVEPFRITTNQTPVGELKK